MSDPSLIGSTMQALLLMNPDRAFKVFREGDDMVIHTED